EAQKTQMGQLESQLAQIALQQYQDRGLNSTVAIMTSTSTDDFISYLTVMQQVTDTANTLFTALQLEQGTLADLERSEKAAVETIQREQATLESLDREAKNQISEANSLLRNMTVVVSGTARVGSLYGYNAIGKGSKDPYAAVPNPSRDLKSPMDRYLMTSAFGMRIHPISGAYHFHDGMDMAGPCGTAILAPANGLVLDYYWGGGYGNRLVVDHGMVGGRHIVTSFNHLSAGIAKPGTSVVQGQVIALVGTTGTSTGCHLHYMVWADGEMVNPALFVPR
ncbi:MAG: M23 family metallopeptidase, partial [Propionibacteriaceae bacterium]|nr:M23 family metallopeptidase [Propionibacteriaceae bacterium]